MEYNIRPTSARCPNHGGSIIQAQIHFSYRLKLFGQAKNGHTCKKLPPGKTSLGDQDLHAAPLEFLGVGVRDSVIGDEGMHQFQRTEAGE